MLLWYALCLALISGGSSQGPTSKRIERSARRNLENALDVVYEWKYMDYDFGSEKARQAAVQSGEFNYKNAAPIDVDRWHDTTFVTVIRDKGVPSSLNIVSNKIGKGGPLLRPYPDWSWARFKNCSGITSVYRVAIDRCDRLWVIDNGVIGSSHVCPAQLLAFDLRTSRLLKREIIPNNVALNSTTGNGLLITPVVQTFGRGCETTFVYIADVEGYAIIVYDGSSFRRVTSSAFVYDPRATTYTIQGQSFSLADGPLGMAVSSKTQNLYFSPMSSFNLDAVDTRALRSLQGNDVQYRVYRDILWTQSSAKAISSSGILFFGLVNDTSIGCWNEFKPLTRCNIEVIAANPKTLQFTSGMKIKECRRGEELWVMTNRYQKIATGTTDFSEVNFRILKGNVGHLTQSTRCQPTHSK